jgi:hypothetical protein
MVGVIEMEKAARGAIPAHEERGVRAQHPPYRHSESIAEPLDLARRCGSFDLGHDRPAQRTFSAPALCRDRVGERRHKITPHQECRRTDCFEDTQEASRHARYAVVADHMRAQGGRSAPSQVGDVDRR